MSIEEVIKSIKNNLNKLEKDFKLLQEHVQINIDEKNEHRKKILSGLKKARQEGIVGGRRKHQIQNLEEIKRRLQAGENSQKIYKSLGISRATFYNLYYPKLRDFLKK